jgi:indole-3-glycerol phosphate synthase
MTNILEKIIQDKKESLLEIKKVSNLNTLENKIKSLSNFLDFKQSITKNENVSLIT